MLSRWTDSVTACHLRETAKTCYDTLILIAWEIKIGIETDVLNFNVYQYMNGTLK